MTLPNSTLTRLAFRLLEHDEHLHQPVGIRMDLGTCTVEDLVGKVWEQDRLAEALELAGEPAP